MTTDNCSVRDCMARVHARQLCRKHYIRFMRYGDPEATKVPTRGMPESERALFYLERRTSDACWEWSGGHDQNGYGFMNVTREGRRTTAKAHRLVWTALVGPIGADMELDHLCHNHGCCNPDHLREVPHKVNMENRRSITSRNTSGLRGVHMDKRNGGWVAYVRHNNTHIHLGRYEDKEEAFLVAEAKRSELFTDYDKLASRAKRGTLAGSGDVR